MTGHPTDQLPSRNIVPYYEMPIYRTTGTFNVTARSLLVDNGGAFCRPVAQEMKCSAIQLSMIPHKLIEFCKKINMITSDSDSFLTIKKYTHKF